MKETKKKKKRETPPAFTSLTNCWPFPLSFLFLCVSSYNWGCSSQRQHNAGPKDWPSVTFGIILNVLRNLLSRNASQHSMSGPVIIKKKNKELPVQTYRMLSVQRLLFFSFFFWGQSMHSLWLASQKKKIEKKSPGRYFPFLLSSHMMRTLDVRVREVENNKGLVMTLRKSYGLAASHYVTHIYI